MLERGENTSISRQPEIGLETAYEVMGGWDDPITHLRRHLVRFFCVDAHGAQVGPDAFSKILGPVDFLVFTCAPWQRTAIALEPQEEPTREDQARVAEILRSRMAGNGQSLPSSEPEECVDASDGALKGEPI
jgi:hypothetical protein